MKLKISTKRLGRFLL